MKHRVSLGFDFGTESVRAVLVQIDDGVIVGQASAPYEHGVIDRELPAAGSPVTLPRDFALQHPSDWLNSAASAYRQAAEQSGIAPADVIGIGVDFTSCTMLPALADGTPLCLVDRFSRIPLAWPRLWKHHAAKAEADRMTQIALQRNEPWLARYGQIIGLEWFFPKVLEALNHAPDVYRAADLWIEAGDWFIWQLIDGPFPRGSSHRIVRSACQAGYKALWNHASGYPNPAYFAAVHPGMADVVAEKMPGVVQSPGSVAGTLTAAAADLLGLRAGIPVATATIDAHAGVPGAGVALADTMVLVLGTSACHMLNSPVERPVGGVAGIVQDGILPGYFGYETGQASVGDAFAWLVDQFKLDHRQMIDRAAALPPGSAGVLALDWLNGCRTPLMDGRLSGGFLGITLGTRPEHLYRALLEATAFGLRRIVDLLRDAGVRVERFVASGGLPTKNPLLMQIYADVLNEPIALAPRADSCAVGAAILGCLAAGADITGYATAKDAIQTMAGPPSAVRYQPDGATVQRYKELYALYRQFGDESGTAVALMRKLREFE